jgi:hypothetical protein
MRKITSEMRRRYPEIEEIEFLLGTHETKI